MAPPTTHQKQRTKKRRLAPLPPEPWGWKLKRAREHFAEMTIDEAVPQLGRYIVVHGATISRLEHLDEPPAGRAARRHRLMAYILCLIYGIDPGQLDLTIEDVPAGMRDALHADFQRPGPHGGGESVTPGPRSRSLGTSASGWMSRRVA